MQGRVSNRLHDVQAAIEEIKIAQKPHRMVVIPIDEDVEEDQAGYQAVKYLNPPNPNTPVTRLCSVSEFSMKRPVRHCDQLPSTLCKNPGPGPSQDAFESWAATCLTLDLTLYESAVPTCPRI